MCTKIVLLNMTKLQQNSSNNILSIRSEHYVLPATITLKPITHLLVLMLIGGNRAVQPVQLSRISTQGATLYYNK
jgi:hypothetical protein